MFSTSICQSFKFSLLYGMRSAICVAYMALKVQGTRGLRWIPRHSEAKKGVVADEMLRGAGIV